MLGFWDVKFRNVVRGFGLVPLFPLRGTMPFVVARHDSAEAISVGLVGMGAATRILLLRLRSGQA